MFNLSANDFPGKASEEPCRISEYLACAAGKWDAGRDIPGKRVVRI